MKLFLITYLNNLEPLLFHKMVVIAENTSQVHKWIQENIPDMNVVGIVPIDDSVMTSLLVPRSINGKHYKLHIEYTLEEDGEDIYTKLRR